MERGGQSAGAQPGAWAHCRVMACPRIQATGTGSGQAAGPAGTPLGSAHLLLQEGPEMGLPPARAKGSIDSSGRGCGILWVLRSDPREPMLQAPQLEPLGQPPGTWEIKAAQPVWPSG